VTERSGPVHLRLAINDVSLADAPSTPVAETTIVVPSGKDLSRAFEIAADLDPKRQFAVTAHVDQSGDGALAPGDLITTQRVSVPAEGSATVQVDIPLTELR